MKQGINSFHPRAKTITTTQKKSSSLIYKNKIIDDKKFLEEISKISSQGVSVKEIVYLQHQITQLERQIEEQAKDAQLAAELGSSLLKENTRLLNELQILEEKKREQEEEYNKKINNLESIINEIHNHYINNNDNSMNNVKSLYKDEIIQLEKKNEELELEKKNWKNKYSEVLNQLHNSERIRFELLEEYEDMKKQIENFESEMNKDQQENQTLREIIETQKSALEEMRIIKEEYEKTIKKLNNEKQRLSTKVESVDDFTVHIASLEEQNKMLKKDENYIKKLEKELIIIKEENFQMKELLSEKEQLTQAIQFLMEENKMYRKEVEEMRILLDDAKKTANELRGAVEENNCSSNGYLPLLNELEENTLQYLKEKSQEKTNKTYKKKIPNKKRKIKLEEEKNQSKNNENKNENENNEKENNENKNNENENKNENNENKNNENENNENNENKNHENKNNENKNNENKNNENENNENENENNENENNENKNNENENNENENNENENKNYNIELDNDELESSIEEEDEIESPKNNSNEKDLINKLKSLLNEQQFSNNKIEKKNSFNKKLTWDSAIQITRSASNSTTTTPSSSLLSSLSSKKVKMTSSMNQNQRQIIQSQLRNYQIKAKTYTMKKKKEKNQEDNIISLDEKEYLLKVLDNKLQSAESRINDMDDYLKDRKRKGDLLQELNEKLNNAEKKLLEKEKEIFELQEQLQKEKNSNLIKNIQHLKVGWLTKKGNIFPTWKRRWFTLSGLDHRLYYSSSSTDRFLGMILLNHAFIQKDTYNRSGKEWCFIINAEHGQRQYFLVADTEKEMEEWILAIQEQIQLLNTFF